jgi:hypothetical protein
MENAGGIDRVVGLERPSSLVWFLNPSSCPSKCLVLLLQVESLAAASDLYTAHLHLLESLREITPKKNNQASPFP